MEPKIRETDFVTGKNTGWEAERAQKTRSGFWIGRINPVAGGARTDAKVTGRGAIFHTNPQKNACNPVWARPRIRAWTSWVPS